MPLFSGVVSKAMRSRFWLTFAAFWLVGWLAFTPVHSLSHDLGCGIAHCGDAPSTGQPHSVDSCLLCQLSVLPVTAVAGQWQLVSQVSYGYLVPSGSTDGTDSVHTDFTLISRRGPPPQLSFASTAVPADVV